MKVSFQVFTGFPLCIHPSSDFSSPSLSFLVNLSLPHMLTLNYSSLCQFTPQKDQSTCQPAYPEVKKWLNWPFLISKPFILSCSISIFFTWSLLFSFLSGVPSPHPPSIPLVLNYQFSQQSVMNPRPTFAIITTWGKEVGGSCGTTMNHWFCDLNQEWKKQQISLILKGFALLKVNFHLLKMYQW